MEALVIIDIQVSFGAAGNKQTQSSIIREIRRARRKGSLIVLVEYKGCGKTYQNITNALVGYDKVVLHKKSTDNGYRLIFKLNKLGYSITSFRICGVNTAYCVLETVMGLQKKCPESVITVVRDACNNGVPIALSRVFNCGKNLRFG